jgi:hypothetical protein
MEAIINGRKFDTSTSELLVKWGREDARYAADGEIAVYRTKGGTLYCSFKYWSNETGPQNVRWYEGEDAVRDKMMTHCSVEHIEKVFGRLEEA